jgi:CheY-like chemotaxis protein
VVVLFGLVLFARPLNRLLRSGSEREDIALFIDQLKTDGVRVDVARSTAEGLRLAGRREYGAVITDMGRWEGGRHRTTAGIDLARELRASGDTTPLLVFTSGRSICEHGQEALATGAEGVISSGVDLLAFLRRHGVAD